MTNRRFATLRTFSMLGLAAGLAIANLVPAAPIAAAPAAPTFTVNSLGDSPAGGNLANGVCETAAGNGQCTLRAAVMKANHFPGGGVTIVIPANALPYQITIPQVIPDYRESDGDFNLNADMTIVGGGAAGTVIDGNNLDRVFNITGTATVAISGLTLQNGYDDHNGFGGGAIRNLGRLTLSSSVLRNDRAQTQGGAVWNTGTAHIATTLIDGSQAFGSGGGIYNTLTGTITLDSSMLSHNIASGGSGGGIRNGGALTVTRSTVYANQALDFQGGGIDNSGSLTLFNSTLSNNSTSTKGGGLYNGGTANIAFSTIAGNLAQSFVSVSFPADPVNTGGGIFNEINKTVNLRASLLAWNFRGAAPSDCAGNVINSGGYNYRQTSTDCFFNGSALGNHDGDDPGLDAPQDNGGPALGGGGAALTRLLRAGSPALDAIPAGECFDLLTAPLHIDQRGAARPAGGGCDMGALEGSRANSLLLTNLAQNGDAEMAAGSPNMSPAGLPYWTLSSDAGPGGPVPTGNTYYGYYPASNGLLTPTAPGPADRGFSFFAGGQDTDIGLMTETVDVSSLASGIDAGQIVYDFSGWFGGSGSLNDYSEAQLVFYDSINSGTGTPFMGSSNAAGRGQQTELLFASTSGTVPLGTRSIEIDVLFGRAGNSGNNNGLVDNVLLRLNYPNNLFLPLVRK